MENNNKYKMEKEIETDGKWRLRFSRGSALWPTSTRWSPMGYIFINKSPSTTMCAIPNNPFSET